MQNFFNSRSGDFGPLPGKTGREEDRQAEPATAENKELMETLRDYEYFSHFCPLPLRELKSRVKGACDRLDYKGSPIYDEFPDQTFMEGLCRKIVQEIEGEKKVSTEEKTETDRGGEAQREKETGTILPFPESGRHRQKVLKENFPETAAVLEENERQNLKAASPSKEAMIETYELHGQKPEYLPGFESFGGLCSSYSGTVIMGNPGTYSHDGQENDSFAVTGETEIPVHIMEAGNEKEEVKTANVNRSNRPGGPPPDRPWGPPPNRPWGPPPNRPWGPPPNRPWRPWGPPPDRPLNPPPGPGRPGKRREMELSDVIMLLLLGEVQHRRCIYRSCR